MNHEAEISWSLLLDALGLLLEARAVNDSVVGSVVPDVIEDDAKGGVSIISATTGLK